MLDILPLVFQGLNTIYCHVAVDEDYPVGSAAADVGTHLREFYPGASQFSLFQCVPVDRFLQEIQFFGLAEFAVNGLAIHRIEGIAAQALVLGWM